MKIILVADYLSDEITGGGELNNEYLCSILRERGHNVIEKKSINTTLDFVKANMASYYIVANFVDLAPNVMQEIMKCRYIIYEHDHKYLRNRNPAVYDRYVAPREQIINRDFYRRALGVFCQSTLHSKILRDNLQIDNVKNLGGNIWSDESLDFMEQCSSEPKQPGFSVMNSPIGHKNTSGAINYCESLGEPYTLISDSAYFSFLKKLSQCEKFVFIPKTPETLSRVAVEARMMGVEVHTTPLVGAASEEWFSLKGKELIDKMRQRKEEIVDAVEQAFVTGKCSYFTPSKALPKISLVTSLYKGDEHIQGFLHNITSQTIFEQCELIIIDANSPGNEREIIEAYMEKYPNIIYKRLEQDPGIYGCWNEGIKMATGEYISNANLDDRRSDQQLELFAALLNENPDIDLVYSECFVTGQPNETYNLNSSGGRVYPIMDFSPENMVKCLPGCMPLWRRSMHDKAGLFDEEYKFAGDWEMWLRAVRNGARFKRIHGSHGLYYHNPNGLTTDPAKQREKFEEEKRVFSEYTDVFGDNHHTIKEHFSQ